MWVSIGACAPYPFRYFPSKSDDGPLLSLGEVPFFSLSSPSPATERRWAKTVLSSKAGSGTSKSALTRASAFSAASGSGREHGDHAALVDDDDSRQRGPRRTCRRSSARRRAPAGGGSSRRAFRADGRRRRNWALPVTFARASRRFSGLPITRNSETDFTTAFPSSLRTIFCPFASSPNVTRIVRSEARKTTPSSTRSASGGVLRCSEASVTRTAFASAAAALRAGPKNRVDIEPYVPLSNGTEGRVSHDHVDGVQGHGELVGRHLRERRDDALPHLDLPGVDRDPAVAGDPQIGVEVGGVAPRAGFLPEEVRQVRVEEDDDPPAEEPDEVPAVEGPSRGRKRRCGDGGGVVCS